MRLRVILCFLLTFAFLSVIIVKIVDCRRQNNIETSTRDVREGIEGVESIKYIQDGIRGAYPSFYSKEENEEINKLNNLILKDFNKILQIYAFNPLPEPITKPSITAQIPIILEISYQLKLNDPMFISIYYIAAYRSQFAAHPTDLVYTTNIDRTKGSRIVLGDIINLNSDFVSFFRSWNLASEATYPEEIKQAIIDYISNISDADLLSGMKTADIIGSGNFLNMYSYLTSKGLGISIGVPNYLGDHVEFEIDYNSLKPYLKP